VGLRHSMPYISAAEHVDKLCIETSLGITWPWDGGVAVELLNPLATRRASSRLWHPWQKRIFALFYPCG
jgi:hypothetical protein